MAIRESCRALSKEPKSFHTNQNRSVEKETESMGHILNCEHSNDYLQAQRNTGWEKHKPKRYYEYPPDELLLLAL